MVVLGGLVVVKGGLVVFWVVCGGLGCFGGGLR